MQNTELVKTLRVLNRTERERFITFVESPYWNAQENVATTLKMIRYIFDCFDQEEQTGLKEQYVYQHIYPDMEYSKNKNLYNRRSEALVFLKKFIVQLSVEKGMSDTESQNYLFYFYTKRGLDSLAKNIEKKLDKWRANIQLNWTYKDFFNYFHIALNKTLFLSLHNRGTSDLGLKKILESLETIYAHYYLYYSNGLLATHNKTPLLDSKELNYYKTKKLNCNPYLESTYGKLQVAAFKITHPENDANLVDYKNYTSLLNAAFEALNPNELSTFLTYARQFLTRTDKLSKFELRREIFQLLKPQFDPKNRLFAHEITSNKFYASCYTALRAGEIEWAKNLVENFEDKIIDSEFKDETVAFCKAKILFFQGNTQEALDNLIIAGNTSENQLKYLIRVLELQLLYELDAEHFEATLRSTKRFFDRGKLLQKTEVANFGNALLRTLNTRFGMKKSYTQKLYDEVEASTTTAERDWLLKIIGSALKKCKDD